MRNICIDCGGITKGFGLRCYRCAGIGRRLSEDHKIKLIEGNKRALRTKEWREKVSETLKGHIVSKTTREKISKALTGGKETKIRSRRYREALSERIKKLWKSNEYVRKQMKARHLQPNKTEIFLESFLFKLFGSEYKYVGDGEFILAGKCPDFVNINGQKKIIELFGNYWHQSDDGNKRIELFKKYGYQTLIVWEDELSSLSSLKEKLTDFNSK